MNARGLLVASLLSAIVLPVQAQTTDETALFALGRAQYARTCAQCHGFNMVNVGGVAYDLRKFPLDDETRFRHSVHEGKGNMPAFGGSLTDEKINLIWVYVKNRGKPPENAIP